MTPLRILIARFFGMFQKRKLERELDEEIRSHLEMQSDDNVLAGMDSSEARRAALRSFGGVDQAKERYRDLYGMQVIDRAFRDFRYALRLMFKEPLSTAVMVLTLGVCIGAVSAVFSIVDGTLLRPLPYPQPERLAQLVVQFRFNGATELQSSRNGADWEYLSRSVKTIDVAVYRADLENLNFSSGGEAGYIRQQRVGAGFFRVFGIPPLLGREFTVEEDVPDGVSVTVLSYNLWQRAFGADRDIIGRSVTIAGVPYRIVGVGSPRFASDADVWTPLRPSRTGEGQGLNYLIVSRVRPGATFAQAENEVASVGQTLLEGRTRRGVVAQYALVSLQESATTSVATSLWIVFAATIFVLIIGCANIAGVLLARGTLRASEIATRMAMGATRSVIVRQLLTESLILAIAGGTVGAFVGHFSVGHIKSILPPAFAGLQGVKLDARVLAVVGAISILASVLFGLFPALRAGRVDIRLAQCGRGVTRSRGTLARRALSSIQIALAVAVCIGASLLIRTFDYLSHLDPGLDSTNVITANFALLDARYATADAADRYIQDVLFRLKQIPAVEGAAVAHSLPFERGLNTVIRKPSEQAAGSTRLTNWSYVSSQFFDVFRIPLLRGRGIAESDRPDSPAIVVINDAFAKMHFRGEEPLGARLVVFGENRQVVGIVGDVLQQAGWGNFGPMGRIPMAYVPVTQPGPAGLRAPSPSWVVRTAGPSDGMEKQMQAAVKSVDPLLPIATFRSLNEINLRSLGLQRFVATLLAVTGALALLLASIGTYAMISNSVAERRREFGIRIALGATLTQVMGNCARSGLICAGIGLIGGLVLARSGTRILQGMLYGVIAVDRLTYVGVGAGVLLIAAIASFVPALKISRLDPLHILRE